MPSYLASTFDSIDQLTLTQQGVQVLQMFRAVGSDEDYVRASRRWQEVRGRLL